MRPKSHPLIEAAVKPLSGNPENELAAIAVLERTVDTDHVESQAAISRWAKHDLRTRPVLWIPMIYLLAVLSLILFSIIGSTINRDIQLLRSMGRSHSPKELAIFKGLSPAEILLLGDPALPDLEQKKALWQSAPKNPAYYAEYAGAWFNENGALPDDYLETVRTIDPENAFFLYNVAGRVGAECLSKLVTQSSTKNPPRVVDGVKLKPLPNETEWEITDPVAYEEALAALKSASDLPRLDSYEASLLATRIALFDQSRISNRLLALAYSASQSTQVISFRKVADLLSASLYLNSIEGDAEGFMEALAISDEFLKHQASGPKGSLVAELVYAASAEILTRSIYHGAVRLGMNDLANSYEAKMELFQQERDRKQMRASSEDQMIAREGSVLLAMTLPMVKRQVADPPPLKKSALTAGRRADHDFISAFATSLIAVAMCISTFVVLCFRFRDSETVRILARRYGQLLNGKDWLWIFGLGLALPFLLTFVVSWLTPLGGRSLGMRPTAFLFPVTHFMILLLLLFTLPPLIIRWRLSKITSPFGWNCGPTKLDLLLPVAGVTASLLAFPIVGWRLLPHSALLGIEIVMALWVLKIVVGILRTMFGKDTKRLQRATITHALLPVYAFAFVLSVLCIIPILTSANRWISQDQLSKVVATGFSYYEAEVAEQKRKEVSAILGL